MIKQKRFDIPFGSDIWISAVLGLMLFITSLSLLVSISINKYIQDWNTSVQATFTLELPHQSEQHIPEIMQTLKKYPAIESIKVLDKTYVQKLMLQLGIASIDAPVLIDFVVSKEQFSNFDSDKVLVDIQKILPASSMMKPVLTSPDALSMARTVETLSFGFGFIMVIAMCLTIAFVTYSEVQTHEKTIELFNLLGAPNYFISKIFQQYTSLILLKSFLLSLALNACIYYGIYISYLTDNAYGLFTLSWEVWAYIVLGIPVLMIAIIQLIVPITVLGSLKKKYNKSLQA